MLIKLMPRIGGYKYRERVTLYKGIVQSINSYCASVYVPRITKASLKKILARQRKFLLGVGSMYRTVSYAAAPVITGIIPADLRLFKAAMISEHNLMKNDLVTNPSALEAFNKKYNFNVNYSDFSSKTVFRRFINVTIIDA